MAWKQVASARVSSSGLEGDVWTLMEELPVGTQGLLQLKAFGIGPLMDLAGMEQAAQLAFFAKGASATVLDVYGEGWGDGFISFRGSPVAVLAILAALPAVLYAAGFVGIVVLAILLVWEVGGIVKEVFSDPWMLALVGGVVLGALYLTSSKRR